MAGKFPTAQTGHWSWEVTRIAATAGSTRDRAGNSEEADGPDLYWWEGRNGGGSQCRRHVR